MPYNEEAMNRIGGYGMTKVITAADALAGLKEIVAEVGPDTMRQCSYAEYGTPGNTDEYDDDGEALEPIAPHCIVGYFLNRNGVPLSTLRLFEGETVNGISNTELGEFGIELEPGAYRVLEQAQRIQDANNEWEYALVVAQDMFNNIQKGID